MAPWTAMDGRVLLGLNRSEEPKSLALAYGVSTPKKGGAFLWVLDDHDVRRIAWDAILALPRVPAGA